MRISGRKDLNQHLDRVTNDRLASRRLGPPGVEIAKVGAYYSGLEVFITKDRPVDRNGTAEIRFGGFEIAAMDLDAAE